VLQLNDLSGQGSLSPEWCCHVICHPVRRRRLARCPRRQL